MRTTGMIMVAAIGLMPAALTATPFRIAEVAVLDNPWGMAFLPDGQALVTEKPGRIRILRTNGQLSAPLSGVPAVFAGGQNGLLDVALSHGFATNRRIYFTFTETVGGVARLALASATFADERLTNVTVIWRALPASGGGHPGGRIAVTSDESIYLTTGDRQQFTPAQDPLQGLGKILKVNRLGQPRSGNPFLGNPAYLPEIWTLGHRNPYGLAYDGRRRILWSHEMGPSGGDELNVIVAGRNYGWPEVSEGDHYDGRPIPRHSTRPEFAPPAYAWPHTAAPSGLIVYRGTLFSGWRNSLIAGGLAGQSLYRFATSGATITAVERFPIGFRVRDVEQGPDGALWVLTDGSSGRILKLTPAP